MTKEDLFQLVGRNLRKYRDENNLTQNELAEIVGISTPFLANLERGKKGMSLPVLVNIANALHVSPDYLLREESPENRLGNMISLLRDEPESFIMAMEKMIRLCKDEFGKDNKTQL
jgi:transcriptional regulator with XRE-family HTH domain